MSGIDEVFSWSLNRRQQRDYLYMYIHNRYLMSKYAVYMHVRAQFNCGILTN